MGLIFPKEKLFHSIDANNLADVDRILTRKPNLANAFFDRKQSAFPLGRACWLGKMEMAELLIAKGADVNKRSANGFNAIFFAAVRGRTEIIALLISKGTELELADEKGLSPLDHTILNGFYNAGLLLAKHVN